MFIKAVIRMENGIQPYSDETIQKGISPFNNKIYTFEIAKELFFKIVDSYENKNLLVSESKNTLSKNIKVATSSYLYNNLFKKYSYNLQSHQFFTTFLKKHILQKS